MMPRWKGAFSYRERRWTLAQQVLPWECGGMIMAVVDLALCGHPRRRQGPGGAAGGAAV